MAATIDAETRRKANLRVLQRIDADVVDLAITATHVVLYEFNNSRRTWEKKNVEGSLFVTKRSDSPRFKIIVLNRSSTENLEVPITASFQMQVKEPYMIFRDSSNSSNSSSSSSGSSEETIRGIWFHDGKERDQIASYLQQVVKSLIKIEEMERNQNNSNNVVVVAPTPPQPPSTAGRDERGGDGDDDAAARRDAGAALLSTLRLGPTTTTTTTARNDDDDDDAPSSAPPPAAAPPVRDHPGAPPPPSRGEEEGHHPHALAAAAKAKARQPPTTTNNNNNNNNSLSATHQNLVLDKKSLQLSLLSLIQDERFLDLIHAQYLKVLHTRAARQQQGQHQQQQQQHPNQSQHQEENNGTN